MRSSRMLCLLLSVFLCFSSVLFPAAAAGNYWTIDDLEADPLQELEDIKGAGPAVDQPSVMSFYEFDDVAPGDQPMLFSMNRGVEAVAEQGETSEGTVLKLSDIVSLMSVPSSASAIVEVFHEEMSVAGVKIPAWTEYVPYPEDGASPVSLVGSSSIYSMYHFLTPIFSVPDTISGGEVKGFHGVSFSPNIIFSSEIDLSSFGEFSSFSLSGTLNAVQGFYRSSVIDYVRCQLALYVNGAHVRTFDVDSSGFIEFANFEYDGSQSISSICFEFIPVSQISTPYYSGQQRCCFSLEKSSTIELTIDMSEGTFRHEVTTGIGNIFQGILGLPGKIVNLLVDGLKSLFIPSEDDMTSLTGRYQQLLSERLGFIWQAYELVSNLFTGILDALESGGAYEFSFPGISFPFNGEELVLLPETPVSLENEVMDVIRPVLGTIVCFIAVVGFINVAEGMVMALISGVSYYEFLHGKRGGSG